MHLIFAGIHNNGGLVASSVPAIISSTGISVEVTAKLRPFFSIDSSACDKSRSLKVDYPLVCIH